MTIAVAALACVSIGVVIGWLACSWHWHARLNEAWSQLRAAAWRRQVHHVPVKPERALDIADVTDAFGLGLVVERMPDIQDADTHRSSSWQRDGGLHQRHRTR